MRSANGFTLIELLVSVTIVAIVTVVAVVYYSSTLAKSRDSRRMSDLEKIRIAAEVAKQTTGVYPASVAAMVSGGYLQQQPNDPKVSQSYYYNPLTNYSYVLCARMEDVGSTNCTSCTSCGDCGGSCNYRLTNP